MESAIAPLDGIATVARKHERLRSVAEGHGEFRSWRQSLEHFYRFLGPLHGLPMAAKVPVETRQPAQVVALLGAVLLPSAKLERRLSGFDARFHLTRDVGLVSVILEQRSALFDVGGLGVLE